MENTVFEAFGDLPMNSPCCYMYPWLKRNQKKIISKNHIKKIISWILI